MWVEGTESQTLLKRLGENDDMVEKVAILALDDAWLCHKQNLCNWRGFAIKALIPE